MVWMDYSGKEMTSTQTESRQTPGSGLYSISSLVEIGRNQLQEVTCIVMSEDRKQRLTSKLKMAGEHAFLFVFNHRNTDWLCCNAWFALLVYFNSSVK